MSLPFDTLQGFKNVRPGERKYLQLLEDRLPADTVRAIREKRALILDSPEFIRRQLVAGDGVNYLLNQETNDDFVRGVSTFQGYRYPDGRNMVVTRMAIRHGVDIADPGPAEANPARIKYFNNSNNVPAMLLSGDMEIRVRGEKVYESRIQRFFQPGAVFNMIPGFTDVVYLETPFAFIEKKEIVISYQLPTGAVLTVPGAGVANDFIEVEFFGPKVVLKN